MKSIELTQSQIKALQSGATMFLFTIDNENISIDSRNPDVFLSAYKFECSYCKGKDSQCTDCYGKGYIWDLDCESKEEFIAKYSPIQKNDKDIFVQEEFTTDSDEEYGINDELVYYSDTEDYWFGTHEDNPQKYRNQWLPASKMTKEQSRFSFNECIDARIVKVQDWIKYLDTKNKKAIESFTFHVSNEPISQKRRRAFESFCNQQMQEQNINRTYEDNDYVFLVEFA